MPTELADELATFARRFGVPAVGAAIVTSGARPLIATTGVRVRGGTQTVTNSDRWHIGSCCKSMTAALVARLVERGATDWEAPLPELLGDLGDSIHPGWDVITLSQLLLHRAGLPANMTRRDLIAANRPPADDRAAARRRGERVGAASAPARALSLFQPRLGRRRDRHRQRR